MSRSSQPVDDRTPIAGSRMDIDARIGWLLRTHRTVAGLSLREMSATLAEHGVRLSPASLSRIEGEGQLSAAALDGYATVLGLPTGSLRSCAELLLTNFGGVRALTRPTVRVDLEEFSAICDAVMTGTADAGTWMRFAYLHQEPSGFGLPSSLMTPQLERLAGETARSLTQARLIRRGALMVLRDSAYGALVHDVAARAVTGGDVQGHWDVMNILSVAPSADLLHWAGDLLADDSTYTVIGAGHLVQSLLRSNRLAFEDWEGVLPQLEAAWRRTGDDAARHAALAELSAALPQPLQQRLAEGGAPEPAPSPTPRRWTRDRGNPHYGYAESLALEACARRGHSEEPLLARLLFESFFDPRGSRRSNATVMVLASPFAGDVVRLILERRDRAPDHASWVAALRVAAFCHTGEKTPDLDALLAVTDPDELMHGLTIASRLDDPLPDEVVSRGLAGDELVVRRTLYCLGMQGDGRRLEQISADPDRASWVRGGARWWRAQGPRLVD